MWRFMLFTWTVDHHISTHPNSDTWPLLYYTYNNTHAQTVCTRRSFSSPSSALGNEAIPGTTWCHCTWQDLPLYLYTDSDKKKYDYDSQFIGNVHTHTHTTCTCTHTHTHTTHIHHTYMHTHTRTHMHTFARTRTCTQHSWSKVVKAVLKKPNELIDEDQVEVCPENLPDAVLDEKLMCTL